MPQQDDADTGNRRANGSPDLSALLGPASCRDYVERQNKAFLDDLRRRTLPDAAPYTIPQSGLFSGAGAYQAVQRTMNQLQGYGRVTNAQRSHLLLVQVAESQQRSQPPPAIRKVIRSGAGR